uniref:Peptide deformylase n=1 Tax=Apteryx owenii TaxID=8824 RepID=A0A8B9NQX6_APTOW
MGRAGHYGIKLLRICLGCSAAPSPARSRSRFPGAGSGVAAGDASACPAALHLRSVRSLLLGLPSLPVAPRTQGEGMRLLGAGVLPALLLSPPCPCCPYRSSPLLATGFRPRPLGAVSLLFCTHACAPCSRAVPLLPSHPHWTPTPPPAPFVGVDETGAPVSWEATGWAARIIQHEMDHLDGILYIDRMDSRTFANVHWAELLE